MVVAEPWQLSLFDADVADVGPGDLEGLLAGTGQIVRLGGTARVSVVVAEAWRARTLLAEYAQRGVAGTGSREALPPQEGEHPPGGPDTPHPGGPDTPHHGSVAEAGEPEPIRRPGLSGEVEGLTGESRPDQELYPDPEPEGAVVGGGSLPGSAGTEAAAVDGHISVRTAFSACLAPLAARWLHGAVTRPPEGFELNGPMLRLWYVAAGRALGPSGGHSQAVVLGLSTTDQATWPAVVAALRRLGLPGALLGPRGGGPAYRIVGRRRVARFGELIGAAPATAPPDAWPVVSPAGRQFRPRAGRASQGRTAIRVPRM